MLNALNVSDFTNEKDSQIQTALEPFKYLKIRSVFNDDFLRQAKMQVLDNLSFDYKCNDLFSFNQSKALYLSDININNLTYLKEVINVLYSSSFKTLLEDVFDVELNENVIDLSASIYKKGDYLLCHNDKIKENYSGTQPSERRIAFILYLVDENWSEEDGGHLDLIETAQNGLPFTIKKRLLPEWNSISLFRIFEHSYHQVSEVLKDKDRVSLVGWFHGPIIKKDVVYKEIVPMHDYKTPEKMVHITALEESLTKSYLDQKSISKIRDIFLEESCIELQKFLKQDIHLGILKELSSIDLSKWIAETNDLSFRKNHHLSHVNEPKILRMFRDCSFVGYLNKITGLDLKKYVLGKVRKYTKSDYSMVNDNYIEPMGLDLSIYFFNGSWDGSSNGGTTHYIADSETLISRVPVNNTLYLVYRDEGVHKFVKHLSEACANDLYELCITYLE